MTRIEKTNNNAGKFLYKIGDEIEEAKYLEVEVFKDFPKMMR